MPSLAPTQQYLPNRLAVPPRLGVILAALVLPIPLWSQTAALNLGAAAGLPGTNVTIDVNLIGTSWPAALQWRLNYPSADLSFVGAQAGPSAIQADKSVQCDGADGEATCVLFGFNRSTISDGVVAVLTFQISATATPGAKDIGLSNVSAATVDGGAIPTTSSGGSIDVQQIANLPPVISDNAAATNEDTPVNVSLEATDPEGGPLTYAYTQPANGSVSGTAPSVVYTPNPDFHGQDQFAFQATDALGLSNSGTISVTVAPVNDPPSATGQGVTATEDTALPIVLRGTDPDGDALTFAVETGPAHGALTGTAPNLTYTPNPQFSGQDQFTFLASDTQGASDTATVAITVQPSNDEPTPTDQNLSTPEDTPLSILLTGTDPDGDLLIFTVQSQPPNGTLSGMAPNVTYTPHENFHGEDSFTFQIQDQGETQAAATVTTSTRSRGGWRNRVEAKGLDGSIGTIHISVEPVNDAPVAQAQSITVGDGLAVVVAIQASDPDGDPLNYEIESGPSHGTLSGTAPGLTYTPEEQYSGPDSFTFRAVDPDGAFDSAVVSLAVEAGEIQNGPPDAISQDITTDEDVALEIALGATDPDGDTLTYTVVVQPANGVLSGEPPNLIYTPDQDFHGGDALTFSVADGNGNSDEATVGISVNPINDLPTTNGMQVETEIGESVEIKLEAQDPDGDPLTFVVQTNPSHGSLSGSAPELTYTPHADFTGPDSFDFLASDTGGESVSGRVSITVRSALTLRDKPAVFTPGGMWMIDEDADGEFEGPPSDREFSFSADGEDVPVVGDWSSSGQARAGVFVNGSWYLDANGNGIWDGAGIDLLCSLGRAGDIPIVGDWDGSGTDNIGVFRSGTWLLDWNGNGVWDGGLVDREYTFGNRRGTPVVGDWTGSGRDRIGTFAKGSWELDANGNGHWDGSYVDRFISLGDGSSIPVVGDWNGSGSDKVGTFKQKGHSAEWQLDRNGDGVSDSGDPSTSFGGRGDQPVVGDWDGSGPVKIGVFNDGSWLLDYDGNGKWDGETVDRRARVGGRGDKPVSGRW